MSNVVSLNALYLTCFSVNQLKLISSNKNAKSDLTLTPDKLDYICSIPSTDHSAEGRAYVSTGKTHHGYVYKIIIVIIIIIIMTNIKEIDDKSLHGCVEEEMSLWGSIANY